VGTLLSKDYYGFYIRIHHGSLPSTSSGGDVGMSITVILINEDDTLSIDPGDTYSCDHEFKAIEKKADALLKLENSRVLDSWYEED
jgi:hypothetical protein